MILPTILFAALALAAAVAALHRFISIKAQPSVPFSIVETIAIFIPISIIFLVPLDILSSNDDDTTSHNVFYVDPKYILMFWKFDYWSAFVLMWAFLPFVQEYYRSGEFTQVTKVKDSIKNNLKFQLIVGSIGAVGLTYFFFRFGFTFQTFKDLLIALSHSYSLVLSLWLMSHGLITIPRRRWLMNVNLEYQMECLYCEVPKLYEDLNESTYNFKDICSIIESLRSIPDIDKCVFGHEIQILSKQIPSPEELDIRNHIRTTQYTSIQQLSHSTLSKLHCVLRSETTNYKSALYQFSKAKLEISRLEDIVDSKRTGLLHFRHGSDLTKNGRLNFFINAYAIPSINLLASATLFTLSFIVIESELLHSTKLSIINMLMVTTRLSATFKFIVSFVVLAYMVICSLISLTRIKLFRMYHLFPNESNPVSVVFFTMYSNRLTVPLSYNFLTLLQSARVHSQFDEFLGKSINLSVLGGFFNTTLPRLVIIPVLFASFDVFDRIKKKLSFDYFDAFDSDDEIEGDQGKRANRIRDGKSIIQRETGPIRGSAFYRGSSVITGLTGPREVAGDRLIRDSDDVDVYNDEVGQDGVITRLTDWFTKSRDRTGDSLQIV